MIVGAVVGVTMIVEVLSSSMLSMLSSSALLSLLLF
jgi:hypothetical protein